MLVDANIQWNTPRIISCVKMDQRPPFLSLLILFAVANNNDGVRLFNRTVEYLFKIKLVYFSFSAPLKNKETFVRYGERIIIFVPVLLAGVLVVLDTGMFLVEGATVATTKGKVVYIIGSDKCVGTIHVHKLKCIMIWFNKCQVYFWKLKASIKVQALLPCTYIFDIVIILWFMATGLWTT